MVNLTYNTWVDKYDIHHRPLANTAVNQTFTISSGFFAVDNASCPITEYNFTQVLNNTGVVIDPTVYANIFTFDNTTNIFTISNYAGLEPLNWTDI